MPNQWPDPLYSDGSFATATACGLPRLSSPIAATTAAYVLAQDFVQALRSYAPLAQGTAHPSSGQTPDYSAFKLVSESERTDMGGGLVRWTRTYAKVPDSYSEFETYAYNYIGFEGVTGINVAVISGRQRMPLKVQSRVSHDFFLCVAGATYPTPDLIPFIPAQTYRVWQPGGFWIDADYLTTSPPYALATVPARSASATPLAADPGYDSYMANAANLGWASGVISYNWAITGVAVATVTLSNGANPGQLVAEDSNLGRWMGPIWERITRYILAK